MTPDAARAERADTIERLEALAKAAHYNVRPEHTTRSWLDVVASTAEAAAALLRSPDTVGPRIDVAGAVGHLRTALAVGEPSLHVAVNVDAALKLLAGEPRPLADWDADVQAGKVAMSASPWPESDPFTALPDEPHIEDGVHHPYSAFNQGWDAAAGVDRNPYPVQTREHRWWFLGFEDRVTQADPRVLRDEERHLDAQHIASALYQLHPDSYERRRAFWALERLTGGATIRDDSEREHAIADAAWALVDKLHEIHASSAYRSVWTVAEMHGGPYRGPTYTAELTALHAALAGRSRATHQQADSGEPADG